MNKKIFVFLKIAVAVLVVYAALHIFFSIIPYPELDVFLQRDFSTRVYDRKNKLVQITSLENGLRREYVPIKEIPSDIKIEFIKAEDKRFYYHNGVDLFAIIRAAFQNAKNNRNISGASTITMQLAKIINESTKNQFNEFKQKNVRTLKDKIIETICALKLEARFSKDEILELYLNSIPFGNNVEGIQSASRLYFSTGIDGLPKASIQKLALIPRRPSYYSPEKQFTYPFYFPHLVRYLRDNNFFLEQKSFQTNIFKSKNPFEVHLSADLMLQTFVQDVADDAIKKAVDSRVSNISVLVLDVQTGQVLAWLGNNNFYDENNSGQIDGVRFKNQPGSSIKPLLYALALENEIVKPSDVLADVPMEFGIGKAYIPSNFNNRFNGPVSLRVCLASSLNIPAVFLLDKIGIFEFAQKLEELGISGSIENSYKTQLGLALGAGEISLDEFLPAFTVFARDGKYIPLEFLSEKYHKLKIPSACQEFSCDTARIIADFLSEKNARSLGFGVYQTFETKYPSIFKTGTSNQFQNITALGATSRYAVGVWMGNFSGKTVIGKTGSSLPASVAKQILDYLENTDNLESIPFLLPENYEKIPVCQLSGLKPEKNCVSTVYEFVKKGEELPSCSWHKFESGKVTVHYPQEYQSWLLMNEDNYAPEQVKINYTNMPLTILSPRFDSVFYYDAKTYMEQMIRLEVIGGVNDELEIFLDEKFVSKISRPFVQSIPLEKGQHILKVICGNQENVVFYEVK